MEKSIVALVLLAVSPSYAAETSLAVTAFAQATTYASGLEHPWGLAFLPDGRALVTERPGRLRVVDKQGHLSPPLKGIPKVAAYGQAGLLDVALDPDFSANQLVYLSYVEPAEDGTGIIVVRGQFAEDKLERVAPIYRQPDFAKGQANFGSRLVFAPDKTLFITIGDRFNSRDQAQNLESALGKVLRINRDGSIPKGNMQPGANDNQLSEIWSYGHRNPQGAAIHPATGRLWTVEHGAQGGDEVNHPEMGKNYGWPVITHGKDYDGSKIGVGTHADGMEQPLHFWNPSIAPSGMMFYTGDIFPQWKGSLFIGALQGMMLVRLTLNGDRILAEEHLLKDLNERIRDVRQGPDGAIYCLTDNDEGRIMRIAPKGSNP